MTLPISIREMRPEDVSLIYHSWLKSYRESRDPLVSIDVYFREHHDVVERLIYQSQVLVATPSDDPDTILGWSVKSYDTSTLHYVYVKEAFRRLGIGRALAGYFKVHTHITPYGKRALGEFTSVYNPYLMFSL